MDNRKILSPLIVARQNDQGRYELRLITCTASNEVRVYGRRQSVSDADAETRLTTCHTYRLDDRSAPRFAQRKLSEWQQDGFRPVNPTGRVFSFRTRTLSAGAGAVLNDTLPTMPAIQAPWWFHTT